MTGIFLLHLFITNVFIPTRIYFFFLFKLRQLPRIFKLEWRHLFFTLAATDTDREG